MKAIYFLLGLLVLCGCHTKGPTYDPYGAAQPEFAPVTLTNRTDASLLQRPTAPYRLGPGDAVEIETIGETARVTLTLGPDGKVYYSLLPGISLWGLTIPEARALLQREMKRYSKMTPELVINLRAAASQRVWVLGAVQNPGVYTLSTPTTLLEALATAGGSLSRGLDDDTDLSHSFVLRGGRRLPVNFDALLKRGDLGQNVYLAPGDMVFLRPAQTPSVYVLGAVGTPMVLPFSQELTAARAVLMAGGVTKYAQGNRVAVVRGGLTDPRLAQLDYTAITKGKMPDVLLQPGDIVYVPETPYKWAARVVEDSLDTFVRTIAVNEGSSIGGVDQPAQTVAPSPSPGIIVR